MFNMYNLFLLTKGLYIIFLHILTCLSYDFVYYFTILQEKIVKIVTFYIFLLRYSVGVMPVFPLNVLLKYWESEKPDSSATSLILYRTS